MISRRDFLTGFVSSAFAPTVFATSATSLKAEKVSLNLIPDKNTSLWGVNGSSPGSLIRVKKGTQVQAEFLNTLGQPSSLHWHGVRIDNKMDGVPGLTQGAVKPNARFSYKFIAPDAGTYWYHAHNRSLEQVARGLYGALIVDEEKPPVVDHDIVVFIDDWRINKDGSLAGGFNNMHDQAHEGRLGNIAKAIFQAAPKHLKNNERIRLRFINAATDRIFPLQISGVTGKIVAYDGMPLITPAPLDTIILAPAQRVDIIADVTGSALTIDFIQPNGLYRLGNLAVNGTSKAPHTSPITALPPNRYTAPKIEKAIALTLTMEGGAMSRHMMGGNGIWAFNGKSGMTDAPFHRFKRGETALINLVNDTRFPHGIHLHGHHFQAITAGKLGPLRDTILVDAGEQQEIACVFDNPGKWLLHCHMLGHQASGMKTWVEVNH